MGLHGKKVDKLLYLEERVHETKKDTEIRIAKGWGSLNRMEKIRISKIQREQKVRFFHETV